MNSESVFIARQPILDKNRNIYAYELLFRSKVSATAGVTDDFSATVQVVINTLMAFGVQDLIGNKPGFININDEILYSDVLVPLDKKQFFFEILETTKIDDRFLARVDELRAEGYVFALDDFVFSAENFAYFSPLFNRIDVLKVDLMLNDMKELQHRIRIMRDYSVRLLAEKVETPAEYEYCLELGFDLFQGYFFSKPTVFQGTKINPQQFAIIELIRLLGNDADINEIEATFKKYPDLTINLLKFMNSAGFYLRNRVNSVKQAVSLIGMRKLEQWLLLLAYTGENGKSSALFKIAAERAKAMEMLLKESSAPKTDELMEEAFLTGLISMIDVLFQKPLEELLQTLLVSENIYNALIFRSGAIGRVFAIILEMEKTEPNFKAVEMLLKEVSLNMDSFAKISLNTYKWQEEFERELLEA